MRNDPCNGGDMDANTGTDRLYTSPAFRTAAPERIMAVAAIEQQIITGNWPLDQIIGDNNIDPRFREILRRPAVQKGFGGEK